MAYGARLESVLGASPRGFESPILRHRTPGPLQVPGFLLFGTPLVFRAAARPLCVPVGGGTAAGPSGAPHRRCLLDVWFGASFRGLAWPRCGPTVLPQVLGGAGLW